MGAATLRRYHGKATAAKAPELPTGLLEDDDAKEAADKVNEAKIGAEQASQAKRAKAAPKGNSTHPVIAGKSQLTKEAKADEAVGEGSENAAEVKAPVELAEGDK